MKIITITTLFMIFSIAFSCAKMKTQKNLPTVDYVDLQKYMGTWYEIGKLPNSFQKKCLASRAFYEIKSNGTVLVENVCTTKDSNEFKKAYGIAYVVDNKTNSKLKVGFAPIFKYFGWFTGDYYIIDLADDYSYVLVGTPSRKYLWILSRTRVLSDLIYESLLKKASELGFDILKVKKSVKFDQ